MRKPPSTVNEQTCDALTVMFDGSCPLCRREISLYQSLDPLQAVSWRDVSRETEGLSPAEQSRYMARFHVQLEDGRLVSGAAAFVTLWRVMPGWRWLGWAAQLPGVTGALELAYRAFLRLRPFLQRWARYAESRKLK